MRRKKLIIGLPPVLLFFGAAGLTSLRPTPLRLFDFFDFLIFFLTPVLVRSERLIRGLLPILSFFGVLGHTSLRPTPL